MPLNRCRRRPEQVESAVESFTAPQCRTRTTKIINSANHCVPAPGPDYDMAAWFDGSPAPGEVGPAVIEGHIDSAANGPSVFFNLGALTPGNTIDIDRADGSTVHFTVDSVRSYPKQHFPTLQVYGNTTGPELRLITCGGEFDTAQGSYRNNTVVYAHQQP